jgi:hypothetical protein
MYQKGTGANAICRLWSSPDGTTWSLETRTDGIPDNTHTDTFNATSIDIGGYGTASPQLITNKIKVSASDITDAQ